MAMLRSIGTFIENSGLDECWIEAGLYSGTTVKQILDGGHVKRALDAHITSILTLTSLLLNALSSEQDEEQRSLKDAAIKLNDLLRKNESVEDDHVQFLARVKRSCLVTAIQSYDSTDNPMLTSLRHYLDMVMIMLLFIRAFHTGDWLLHLSSLEMFIKYFFALDKLNYARMIPLYIAEMRELENSEPALWQEFLDGNWIVNKNAIPFCSIGADHALEHINRMMKVSGGIIGITLNESARARFFLVSPEVAKISADTFKMSGTVSDSKAKHHEDNESTLQRLSVNVQSLKAVLQRCGNPFAYDGNDLYNIMTKEVMTEEIREGVLGIVEIGEETFRKFVEERIRSGEISVWSAMKKTKLKLWKSNSKSTKFNDNGRLVELREDRGLFARILIAARSRPDINIQDIISNY